MANLESPNQFGHKGNTGSKGASAAGGKVESPTQVGDKGVKGSGEGQAGGKLVSPSFKTNASEGNGHK